MFWVFGWYSNGMIRVFNSIRVHGWSIYAWSCNDYVTILCEIKQVVREWAEFSYKAMFTCMQLFVGPFLENNNNCWPFFDV